MFIKQSKNTYIRCTDRYGYICNQLTRSDRNYNGTGASFLSELSRQAKDIDTIVDHLLTIYDVDRDELYKDFMEFAMDLAHDHYVLMSEDESSIDSMDLTFNYKNGEELVKPDNNFKSYNSDDVSRNTTDYFLEMFQGKPIITSLQFELTSRCNERCIHCYIPNGKKNNGFDMPLAKVKNLLDQFSQMGGLQVTLSGGEVFMHKDIAEIIRYCRQKDFKINILTNLIALKDSMIPLIKESNIALLQVSLYSMDPSVHDFITTVKGSFEKTKDAIEKLVAADIPVQISCPVMKANWKGYNDVINYGKSLGVKARTDYLLMARADLDTENLANRISVDEVEELVRGMIKYDKFYQELILIKQKDREEGNQMDKEKYLKSSVCGVGYDNCCVAANGDVYPCSGWQDFVVGNVYKDSLATIWEKSQRLKELRELTNAQFPECANCEAEPYCSRCLVRNYNESNGDYLAINKHFCDVAFATKRVVDEFLERRS